MAPATKVRACVIGQGYLGRVMVRRRILVATLIFRKFAIMRVSGWEYRVLFRKHAISHEKLGCNAAFAVAARRRNTVAGSPLFIRTAIQSQSLTLLVLIWFYVWLRGA